MRRFLCGLTLAGSALAGPAFAQTETAPAPSEPPTVAQDPAPDGAQPGEPLPTAPMDTIQDPVMPDQSVPPPSRAPDRLPLIDLSLIETRQQRLLYFDPAETYLTPYVGASAENAIDFSREMFDWTPWDRITVLLKDFSDYGNAGARASPNNAILFDIAPLSQSFETFSAGERFYTLANHEIVHVATMDVWNQRDAFWRRVFGGKPMPLDEHPESILYNYLTTPRVNVPRWYLEGSAVFFETWMAGGYGRAQGAYDEMVFRSMVRDGAYFYSPVGLESEGVAVDFQVGVNDYLYGTRFISWLGYAYGPEKVVEWVGRDEHSEAYFAAQFRRVFGKPLGEAWREWIAWEKTFQQQNLASLRAYPETLAEPMTPNGLGSVSRAFVDPRTGDLVGAFRGTGVIAHVGVLDAETGTVRKLTDIKGAMLYRVTSLAYDPERNVAWYTTDNYAYRDVIEIDVATGRRTMRLRDARIGDIVLNPRDKSLWGLRHLNGYVTLVRIPAPYASWNQVHTFDFGRTPFDLDISPDGTMLAASMGEVDGRQSVQVFRTAELLPGMTPVPFAQFELGSATPEGFVFSPDNRYLYGSAYYTGVSNIYRYDLQTREIEAMTNASTGFFRPIPQADGSMIVYEYTGDGFRPGVIRGARPLEDLGAVRFLGAEIANRHPVVTRWTAGPPNETPLQDRITRQGKYDPFREMRLGARYPIVEGYKGRVAVGYHVIFEDPLQFNQLTATVSFLPSSPFDGEEDWHIDIEYRTLRWSFRYWRNDADFYDLFGPTERARKGDAVIVGYRRSFIYDPPRQLDFTADLAYYRGLDTLPAAQAVQTQFESLAEATFELHYTDTTKSLGAVDHERGWRWNVAGALDHAADELMSSWRGGVDAGVPLWWPNSSAWVYTAAGFATGDRSNPLSSFYMGGWGNNYVDDREVKRYRDFDSLPGYDINEIDARRFARVLGEVNFPPFRFRDVGTESFYLSSARPAVFAGWLHTERGTGDTVDYQSLGFQVDFNFTVAVRLPMTLSLGYAEAFREGEREGGEVLVSLKIL